ncbi:S8 family serine peptidase [Brachyspira alvinipulli]|uniref:S8 family peptidase n=1 Tax=Brachyspira alvinipulli TaxID=84379 RepID=UPI0030052B4B
MSYNIFNIDKEDMLKDLTGKGVKIGIIDSGIEASHDVFKGSDAVKGGVVIEYENDEVVLKDYKGFDQYGHGTACAGIIHSIAKDAELYSIQVLGNKLSGQVDVFLKGLEWAIENKMDIINLSLGTTNKTYISNFYTLLDRAYYENRTLIAAANNDPIPSIPSILSPVIAVEAIESDDQYEFYYRYSNCIEFLARGIYIKVPWINNSYMMMIGNSFAAPHISGIVALLKEKNKNLTPFEIKSILKNISSQKEENNNQING